jgi:hypothetical protein
MKPYQLVIDYEVLEFLQSLRRAAQRGVHRRLVYLGEFPHDCMDQAGSDPSGRDYFIYAQGQYAIKFWIDEAVREVESSISIGPA